MKPIDFKQSTKVLQRSPDMTDDERASLPVWSDGMQCVSCWKPSLSERILVAFGGKVWLGVASGSTQPPVFLSGRNVFKGGSAFSRVRSLAVYMAERIRGVRRALAHMERHPYDEYRFSGKMVYSLVATIIGCVLGSLAYSLAVKLWHIITQ
jgi:hypothetical protein bfra3_11756|nr:MAG TPA: hypothetical protein [Caudoviricetes sp.]